jgi:hypothetical protein
MFKTPESQARYFAAYDATLALWLVPGQAISSTMWYPNIGALSSAYRVYALDITGDMGKSVRTRPFAKPTDFADWLTDVLDELRLEKAHAQICAQPRHKPDPAYRNRPYSRRRPCVEF